MERTLGADYIDIGGGRRGHRDRNTAAGLAGTGLTALWHNNVQEELLALIEGLGLVPNSADMQQIWQATRRLAGRQIRTLTATATLTGDDGLVLVSAAAGNVTLTLPAAAALAGTVAAVAVISSQQLMIVRTDTTANTVTVQRAGSDALGAGSAVNYLLGVSERLRIQSDGVATWHLGSTNLMGRRRHVMTASGNFTVPAWVERTRARGVAGGGGGAGCTANSSGGGGGAGGCFDGDLVVTPGAVMAGVIGAAGAGGASGVNGSNGGDTTFGGMTATGGQGGGSTNTGTPSGGAGGTGSGGTTNYAGGYGTDGIPGSGAAQVAGSGGASVLGGGGRGSAGGGSPAIGQANGSGGGGAYGSGTAAGGAGKIGIIEIWY